MTTRRFVETGSNLLDRDIATEFIRMLRDRNMDDWGTHAIPTRWYHRQLDKMLVAMHKNGINLEVGSTQDDVVDKIVEFKQKLRNKEKEIDQAQNRKIIRMRNPIAIDDDNEKQLQDMFREPETI